MTIINQNNYKLVLNYSPELICLLKQFFDSVEQRNNEVKTITQQLMQQNSSIETKMLIEQLNYHSGETEIDIELVKKLLG